MDNIVHHRGFTNKESWISVRDMQALISWEDIEVLAHSAGMTRQNLFSLNMVFGDRANRAEVTPQAMLSFYPTREQLYLSGRRVIRAK